MKPLPFIIQHAQSIHPCIEDDAECTVVDDSPAVLIRGADGFIYAPGTRVTKTDNESTDDV